MLSDFEPITPGTLKEKFQKEFENGAKETFLQFVERFIKESKHSKATKKIFNSTFKLLQEFPLAKDFYDINDKWFYLYQDYLESKRDKRTPGGCSVNYIAKNIVYVKQFLRAAYNQKVIKREVWKTVEYKAPSEEADVIYLTTEELLQMYNTKLPQYLVHARDRFLIGAFTGLRFSDYSVIKPNDIQNGLIRNRNKKTGEDVVIPVHWLVKEIMLKYQKGLPRAITNQKMNDYLKLIGAKSGLKDHVVKNITKGGIRTSETFEKWELITTHTARRSFATNAFLAGISTLSIMKITGHKTEKSFLKYIRISKEQNARLIENHKFFAKPDIQTK